MKTKNLSIKIVIALVLGITVGSICNIYAQSNFVTSILGSINIQRTKKPCIKISIHGYVFLY